MRVLLIGKFPPCQGGIASKSYWLCRGLLDRDIHYSVVTIAPALYNTGGSGSLPRTTRLCTVTSESPPWFIPGGDLSTEKLISAGLELADDLKVDLVETNYLAPFGVAAMATARLVGVPLLLRHAASDLVKLARWEPISRALTSLLTSADMVVTPHDWADQRPISQVAPSKLTHIPRYRADPQVFRSLSGPPPEPILLFAGKLNYFWRLKALDTLLAVLKLRPGWRLLMVTGGTGKQAFELEVERAGLSDRVTWRSFVSPDAMPTIMEQSTAVWAVERSGGVPDFSYLVSEAMAAGRPCLVNILAKSHPEALSFRECEGLIGVNPDDVTGTAVALDQALSLSPMPEPSWLSDEFQAYLESNAAVYSKVLQDRRSADH